MSGEIIKVNVNNLKLDLENPRLPFSFTTQEELNEEKIVNWMLEDASIIELMLAIGQNNFFVGESLLVVKDESDNNDFIVVEGNRRLTSLKLLQNPSIAKIHNKKIKKVMDETEHRPDNIPCILFDSRSEILQYLGYRHVTGIKSWGMLEKARYLYSLQQDLKETDFNLQCRELAKTIGSRSDYIKRVLTGYNIYLKIQEKSFYKIPQLDDTTLHFNYIADALNRENIREFIGIDLTINNPLEKISNDNLELLTNWFFRKNQYNKSQVLGDSRHLTALNELLGDDKALSNFLETGNFWESHKYVNLSPDTFHNTVKEAMRSLEKAWSYITDVETHNKGDLETLKSISKLSKNMTAVVISKEEDED